MPDPSFGSIGTAGTTSNNVAAPPSVALGQLIVLQVYISRPSNTGNPSCSGFARQDGYTDTGANESTYFLWKAADATDVSLSASSGSYTVAPGSGNSMIASVAVAINDADLIAPFRSSTGATNPTNSVNFPAVTLTGLTAGDLLLWFIGLNAVYNVTTAPSGFTRRTANASQRIHSYTKVATAGSTGSITGAAGSAGFRTNAMGAIKAASVPASDLREYNGTTEVLLQLKEFTSPSTETELTLYEYDGTNQILLH